MSAIELARGAARIYEGKSGFYYEHEDVYGEKESSRPVTAKDAMMPEVCALAITGILAIIGLSVSLVLSYQLLALLFVMPLVGVVIGASYIAYMKKHG